MAAKHIPPAQGSFCNELLSSSDLFQRWCRGHKIPVRGQKEFFPNDSEQQRANLQKTLNEHWMLVKEERVERVGNLVNAEWLPKEMVVKLQSPAGKFWHTMGFSNEGKQYLFPEEALYLMECGNVQVFFQNLPLSIQEGYECFLSAETVTFVQYQVFGHLKRLGYVVNRFDTRLPSLFKPFLSNNRPGTLLKRKLAQSPNSNLSNKKSAASPEISAGQHEDEIKSRVPSSNFNSPDQLHTQQAFQHESIKSDPESDGFSGRNWWINNISIQSKPHSSQHSLRHWDLSGIFFPDVGSCIDIHSYLPPPDPSLLPGALHVSECHVAYWHRNINLKEDHHSRHKCHRQQKQHRCNVTDDKGVCRCRNWDKYSDLMSQKHKRLTYHGKQKVKPLAQPGECTTHCDLLEQVNLIQPYDLLLENSRFPSSDEWRMTFNVYQPDTEFKKSSPGEPFTRLCVCSFDDPVPNLHALKQLSFHSGEVSVTFAVVDHGDISFYCFKQCKLPTDVY